MKAFAALDALDEAAAAKLPFDLAWTLLVRGGCTAGPSNGTRPQRRCARRSSSSSSWARFLDRADPSGLDRVGLRRAPTELAATERRVAELAASGLTNRVASKAFMSPKTVQANLARVSQARHQLAGRARRPHVRRTGRVAAQT